MKTWAFRFFKHGWFYGGIVVLLGMRLWHLGASIDEPHDWRQCDTAYYIRDFYQNGLDLLYPAVCWMGDSDTLALEFPLTEAAVAVTYYVFGESIPLARIVFLIFFIGAVYFFHRISELFFGQDLARLATLVYLALPLSIYYSRAIHIDFSVIFLSHLMVYYFLLAIKQRKGINWIMSSVAACLAFMMKAPYAFFWVIPLLAYTIKENALRRLFQHIWVYVPALGFFLWWQWHVNMINGQSPDWNYILHYHKMTQSPGWYFGTLDQRLTLYPWWILFKRGVLEVAGVGGIVLFMIGIFYIRRQVNNYFLIWWMVALMVYVLLFFNLNFVHNYYQIPLLAPVAILIAGGLVQINLHHRIWGMIGLLWLIVGNVMFAERNYFEVPRDIEEIAWLIKQNTPETALVIVTYGQMDCRNPRILYRAGRRGWSIEEAAAHPGVIRRLQQEEDARYWIYVGSLEPDHMQEDRFYFLSTPQVHALTAKENKLFIYDLSL